MNARYLTIRHLPPDLSEALDKERRRRGLSLEQTVLDLLRAGLGVAGSRRTGLARLAGTWAEAEYQDFAKRMEVFAEIHSDDWK